MPAIGNITVKKNDGTTDIVFNAMAPSAGDTVPAFWRQDTGNTTVPAGHRSTLKMMTSDNGPKTARRARINASFPATYTESTTTLVKSEDKVIFELNAVMPVAVTQAWIDEAVSQFANLLNSAQIKDSLKTGFAPT